MIPITKTLASKLRNMTVIARVRLMQETSEALTHFISNAYLTYTNPKVSL